MVTRLKYFRNDPNHQGRGPGVYYHRGHGYYSQYSVARDKKKKSTGWQTNPVGLPKSSALLHVSDGWLKKKF